VNRSEAIKSLDPKVVLAVARFVAGDGWTIFSPLAFTDLGMPESVASLFIATYESNTDDPKRTIFGEGGKVINELDGVYGLDLVLDLAHELVPGFRRTKNGRGFAAREATEALINHFTKESSDGDTGTGKKED
jgi:hypothetical protein